MSNWENNAFPNKVVKDGALLTQVKGSDVAQPMEIQFRRSQTIQTHNAVSVGASATVNGGWIDCEGFKDISGTVIGGSAFAMVAGISWSNDGVNLHGNESSLFSGNAQQGQFSTDVKAKFARIRVTNNSATAQTVSAWAYLTV